MNAPIEIPLPEDATMAQLWNLARRAEEAANRRHCNATLGTHSGTASFRCTLESGHTTAHTAHGASSTSTSATLQDVMVQWETAEPPGGTVAAPCLNIPGQHPHHVWHLSSGSYWCDGVGSR